MSVSDQDRRVAVVTGGAGAIGGAIAARLARDHTVVVLDRTGGDVVVDLGAADDVRRAAALVLERYGRCDVLVHAAAMAAFVGLSLPVVGAGVTLASHVSPKVTLLGFALAVSAGIAASALKLAGGPNPQAPAPGWR